MNLKEYYRINKKKLILIIFLTLCLFTNLAIVSFVYKDNPGLSNISQFLSGTVGLFISFFGFLALIVTLILQQIQINDNQKNSNKQSFESNFFQLLDLYSKIVSDLELEYDPSNYTGNNRKYSKRGVFDLLYKNFREVYYFNRIPQNADIFINRFKGKDTTPENLNIVFKLDHIKNFSIQYLMLSYSEFYEENQYLLAHYFRTVYHVLKYIDSNTKIFPNINNEKNEDINEVSPELKFYANILRAQLSTYEIYFLYLNCLSDNGNQKFLELAFKYDLFEHINPLLNFRYVHNKYLKMSRNEIIRDIYSQEYTKLASIYDLIFPVFPAV